MNEVIQKNEVEVKVRKKRAKGYLNNEEFCTQLLLWKAEKEKNPNIPMPNYLGECFMKIVNNYGNKSCFAGYSYLDEMKSEALITCVKYAHNFDPNKSTNAFAYFTTVTHNAFLQILNKENALSDFKFQMVKESQDGSDGFDYRNIMNESEE